MSEEFNDGVELSMLRDAAEVYYLSTVRSAGSGRSKDETLATLVRAAISLAEARGYHRPADPMDRELGRYELVATENTGKFLELCGQFVQQGYRVVPGTIAMSARGGVAAFEKFPELLPFQEELHNLMREKYRASFAGVEGYTNALSPEIRDSLEKAAEKNALGEAESIERCIKAFLNKQPPIPIEVIKRKGRIERHPDRVEFWWGGTRVFQHWNARAYAFAGCFQFDFENEAPWVTAMAAEVQAFIGEKGGSDA